MTGECECCHKNPAEVVATVPGIPVSIAWCVQCVSTGVVPMWVAEMWAGDVEGQPVRLADWCTELITLTLAYFEVDEPQFWLDARAGKFEPWAST